MLETSLSNSPTYDAFRETWLQTHMASRVTTVEKGNAFAAAILEDWLDLNELPEDPFYCDGCGDGGVDAAIFVPSDPSEEGSGDVWYLVQSKYGSAFAGVDTIVSEGRKVVRFLSGETKKLNSLSEGLLVKLQQFMTAMGEDDRLVLILATVDEMSDDERESLTMIRAYGKEKLGTRFEVEAVSLRTIFSGLTDRAPTRMRVPLIAKTVDAGGGLKIGVISLIDLYEFLKAYRQQTGDLDRLYDRNVRRFLGGRGKVNRDMAKTLVETPENFGLFNNGITLVAESIENLNEGSLVLIDPAVVNGCQTTRTVWSVLDARLGAGGTGKSESLEVWREKISQGTVLAKLVNLKDAHEAILVDITRYTNSQNKVQDKDFLALESDFQKWAKDLATQWSLYLEIQRGGWDSQLAWQKQNPGTTPFTESANAAELIKVYASGWLSMPGRAMAENRAFTPGGATFREIIQGDFDSDDLYASYLLKREKDRLEFGSRIKHPGRGQTKFLFYAITIELVKHVLSQCGLPSEKRDLTNAVIQLFKTSRVGEILTNLVADTIDTYMTPKNEEGVAGEPLFRDRERGDLNGFLKSGELRPGCPETPKLNQEVQVGKIVLARNGLAELKSALNQTD